MNSTENKANCYEAICALYNIARACEERRPGCLDGEHLDRFDEAISSLERELGEEILPVFRDVFAQLATSIARHLNDELLLARDIAEAS